MIQNIVDALRQYVPQENISLQETMAGHTTFRVGGPADCFVKIENENQLIAVLTWLKQREIPYYVLGSGSNLLVSDAGFRGVILQIADKMNRIEVIGEEIIADAGVTMSRVARTAWEHGLEGLEFASGIPGTIGGGVTMNAGAYGGEMCQVVAAVRVVDDKGQVLEIPVDEMAFGYRTSVIKSNPYVVTSVRFKLQAGDKDQIKARMDDFAARRRDKQPLEYPSAGSTFKRPEGHFAGKLIMDAGLAGMQIGGAQVSEKHCGFVINTGDATSADVRTLIGQVQEKVKGQFGVDLEPEVIYLGE
ncbi:MAG: UDP-N-acetylmuramate dehydrogenase [Lachnospiraceae bacterium]|nr:UDP-N-acetylmuramate dehydrogenase [Lachnospiraceae bacterium]